MTPEQEMGARIIDAAEWAFLVLASRDGSAEVRGEACPRKVVQTLRDLADAVEQRHADHRCPLPIRQPGSVAWQDNHGRIWSPAGISDVAPIVLYQADDGGDLMPLTLVTELYGPITPIGGDGR